MIARLDTSDEFSERWNIATGEPGVGLFANAVQVWALAQERRATVEEAALTFNTTPQVIRQAVEHHYWMYLAADGVIGHEGE